MALDIFGIKKFYETKAGGKEWFSTYWSNKKSRTLLSGQYDPYDPNLGFHYGSAAASKRQLVLAGNGVAWLPNTMPSDGSQRIFIKGPWTNTEMTVRFKWRKNMYTSFQMRSRSNHHGTSNLPYPRDYQGGEPVLDCGFGNYQVKWSDTGDPNCCTQVEVIHDLYKRYLDKKPYRLPKQDTWTEFKQITRTINNTVKVEGWINYNKANQEGWQKTTEFTFTGSNVRIDPRGHEKNVTYCLNRGDKVSGNLNANTKWLNPGYWCWIRINGGSDMYLGSMSVREIN